MVTKSSLHGYGGDVLKARSAGFLGGSCPSARAPVEKVLQWQTGSADRFHGPL